MHSTTSQAPDKIGEILSPQTVPAHGVDRTARPDPDSSKTIRGRVRAIPGTQLGVPWMLDS